MEVIKTKDTLKEYLSSYKREKTNIGFVPTMGALHAGHISLVEQCHRENAITVVSIFVNPTQFNDQNDLISYPRTLPEDIEQLEAAGVDFVFVPDVAEMYPEKDTCVFNFGSLDKVMEGAYRPGHFNGVAQIVSKLFDAVQPDNAYFGEKDFQQLAIIRRMTEMLGYPVKIIGCPIVREKDGLAMSSRNVRLTPEQRRQAPVIAKTLFESREKIGSISIGDLKKWVVEKIDQTPGFKTEYFDIVYKDTLQTAPQYEKGKLQGCIAVQVGTVRLIDNVAY